jgi:hypothetical protein
MRTRISAFTFAVAVFMTLVLDTRASDLSLLCKTELTGAKELRPTLVDNAISCTPTISCLRAASDAYFCEGAAFLCS